MTAETPTINNRKALHEYTVEERLEVGVVLSGTEIKSIRGGKITLGEAWIDVSEKGELWLVNAHIEEYTFANRFNHMPQQKRKLLAHRAQIDRLRKAKETNGLTLIPLKLYFKDRFAKIELGVCRGKHSHDKRNDLLKRDAKLQIARIVKAHR